MITTTLQLDLGEPLHLDGAVLRIVRVSGTRVRLEVRHPEGTRIGKPRLRDRILEGMREAGIEPETGEAGA